RGCVDLRRNGRRPAPAHRTADGQLALLRRHRTHRLRRQHRTGPAGEVNLMTAGLGICHSEVSTEDTTTLHGVQLWLALPEDTRHQEEREFEHYAPALTPFEGGQMLVFLGELWGTSSPVT